MAKYQGFVRMLDNDSGFVRIRERGKHAERLLHISVLDGRSMRAVAAALCEQLLVEISDENEESLFEVKLLQE